MDGICVYCRHCILNQNGKCARFLTWHTYLPIHTTAFPLLCKSSKVASDGGYLYKAPRKSDTHACMHALSARALLGASVFSLGSWVGSRIGNLTSRYMQGSEGGRAVYLCIGGSVRSFDSLTMVASLVSLASHS